MPVAERKVFEKRRYNIKASRESDYYAGRVRYREPRKGASVPRIAYVPVEGGGTRQVGQLSVARAKRVARTRARDKMNRKINGRGK